MTICHAITNEFLPSPGGLQDSILRITRLIKSMDGWTVRLYIRDEQNTYGREIGRKAGLEVISIGAERVALMEPISPLTADRFRADFLILRREIEESINEYPNDVHIVLSFGVPQTGFIAQQVATALGLAHVTCFRGTDFSRDFFDPIAQAAISYVVPRATAIVTTNEEQRRLLRAAFGPKTNITTIYNGVELPKSPWRFNRRGPRIQLMADCGFAFKKGTHLLLRAYEHLVRQGFPIELSVCGSIAPYEEAYWPNVLDDFETRFGSIVRFQGLITKEQIEQMLLTSDVYCSATLGEGCSQARSRALVFGMPIVSTRCGELADLAANASHVSLVPPGDSNAFTTALHSTCQQVLEDTITIEENCVERARRVLSLDSERTAWRDLLTSVAPSSSPSVGQRQFRILMYAHDGRGLGHLRRLCRLAKVLQGTCAVLIVTGLRDAAWLVPDTCEFLHLPHVDSIDPRLSKQWGRDPFLKAGRREGFRIRRAAIESIVESFSPDAMIIDFLPAGKDDEMYTVLDKFPARRYLLLRGVLDDQSGVQNYIFNETGQYLAENRYDRILVMADRKIVDLAAEYSLKKTIADKIIYAGYVAEPITDSAREQTRAQRGISDGTRWVVCSAGGGKEGEELIEYCYSLSDQFPQAYFDIVVGPRSRSNLTPTTAPGNMRVCVSRERRDLPLLHAACDILVCRGGYNTLMEAVMGQARVIVVPINGDHEQLTHARRLASFFPVSVLNGLEELATCLRVELAAAPRDVNHIPLNLNGAQFAAKLIISDLRALTC